MTRDERNELLKESTTLAYAHLRYSGLYRELSNNDEWEQVAEEHGEKVMELLERLVDERFTQIERDKQVREIVGMAFN